VERGWREDGETAEGGWREGGGRVEGLDHNGSVIMAVVSVTHKPSVVHINSIQIHIDSTHSRNTIDADSTEHSNIHTTNSE
jgi:hypothetical protein